MKRYLKSFQHLIISTLFLGCSNFIFRPDSNRYYEFPVKTVASDFKDFEIPINEKRYLHAWHLFNSKIASKGLILFFHGNAQNLTAHHGYLSWITDFGYEVLIFDYGGYGKSPGAADLESTIEDGVYALEYAAKLKPKKLIAFGQSLGGNILIQSLERFSKKDKIDLLVLDSSFLSYRKIAGQKLRSFFLTYPFFFFSYLFPEDKATPSLIKLKNHLLVIHGIDDGVVPINHGRAIFNKFKGPKDFWQIPGGRHIDSFNRISIRNKFLSVLKKL